MPKLYETITAENWWKGSPRNPFDGDQQCVITRAAQLYPNETWPQCVNGRVGRLLDDTAWLLFPERCTSSQLELRPAAQFNDHPDTTVEDVIRVCKVADV